MLLLPSGGRQHLAMTRVCCDWTYPNDQSQLLDIELLGVDEVGKGIALGGRVLSPDANVEGGRGHVKAAGDR